MFAKIRITWILCKSCVGFFCNAGLEVGAEELAQVDMDDARIFGKSSADRIHGDHVFGVIVAYALQVAKFAGYRFVRPQQVNGLHIKPLFSATKSISPLRKIPTVTLNPWVTRWW